MKEYLIELCHGDFIYAKYVYKSCFVKIEMTEDEKKFFIKNVIMVKKCMLFL